MDIRIYVPRPDTFLATTLRRGSAIVGSPDGDGRIRIDYEGGLYGQHGNEDPDQRYLSFLGHAADRHFSNYPTIARASADIGDVMEVGWFNTDHMIVDIEDIDAFNTWVEDLGARAEGVSRAGQRVAAAREERNLIDRVRRGETGAMMEWTRRTTIMRGQP